MAYTYFFNPVLLFQKAHLSAKLANLRELDYPRERVEIIFISDGSTDGTNEALEQFEGTNVREIFLPKRASKVHALNLGVENARQNILVFSDAATLFIRDAVKRIVRHVGDPSAGFVCESLQFHRTPESKQTEGIYWR
jgi:biofilm PGA synthesis N-glycosyltransferase PgaC